MRNGVLSWLRGVSFGCEAFCDIHSWKELQEGRTGLWEGGRHVSSGQLVFHYCRVR